MDKTQEVKLFKSKSFSRVETLLIMIIIFQMVAFSYTIISDGVRLIYNNKQRQELQQLQNDLILQEAEAAQKIQLYISNAYDNKEIDRISEQQLLAIETTNDILINFLSSQNILAEMMVK